MHRLHYLNEVESPARTYAATFQRVFVNGVGMRMTDSQGVEFIDCLANAGALPLGHNHPEVKEAVLQFVSSNQVQQALDLATPAKSEFVHELFSQLPAQFAENARILFCGPSGSDAVEAAIKLAKSHTRRSTLIAFHGAYHGMTAGALGAMGQLFPKSCIGLSTAGVHFAPYPYRFRCPFGTDGSRTDELSLNYLNTLLSDPCSGIPKPAALIVEVVQGEGGCIPAADSWLRGVRQLTREHEVLLIVDEVQTGLGRTGAMFAFEHAGIAPDILVLSKAIGGGYPLAVVLYARQLDSVASGLHAGTFRGNQIAMVAGAATMRIIQRDGLVRSAASVGEYLLGRLKHIARKNPCMGDVRGRGLMVGVEIVDAGNRTADGMLARKLKLNCFENGLIVETGGRGGAVVRLLPPLIATQADADAISERFERSLDATLS